MASTNINIYFSALEMTDTYSDRLLEVFSGMTLRLFGVGLASASFKIFALQFEPTDDEAPFESGVETSPGVFELGGATYLLGEGFYGDEAHYGSGITLDTAWPWTAVTGDSTRRFTPQVIHDYSSEAGRDVLNLVVENTAPLDIVRLTIPPFVSSATKEIKYFVLRVDNGTDYDIIVWRRVNSAQALPALSRYAPPLNYDPNTTTAELFQLADTTPKVSAEDPNSLPRRPKFAVTGNELFCGYVSDHRKLFKISLTVSIYSIVVGDIANEADVTQPGVRWRANLGPWNMSCLIFDPQIAYDPLPSVPTTVVTEGPTWHTIIDPVHGKGIDTGAVDIMLLADDTMLAQLSEGDNSVIIAVTDTGGNISTIPLTIVKHIRELRIVATVTSSTENMKVDQHTGRVYTRGIIDDIDVDVTVEGD